MARSEISINLDDYKSEIVDWLRATTEVGDVFTDRDIIDYVRGSISPTDCFSHDTLLDALCNERLDPLLIFSESDLRQALGLDG